RDSWTESLESWFSGRVGAVEREIWYVKDGFFSRLLPGKFKTECFSLNILEAIVPGGSSQSTALAARVLAIAAGLALVFAFKGKRRWLAIAMGLPWILFAVLAGGWYASLGLGALSLVPLAVEGLAFSAFRGDFLADRDGPLRVLYMLLPLLLPLYAAVLLLPAAIFPYLALTLSSLCASLLAIRLLSTTGRRHFFAIPISAEKSTFIKPLRLAPRVLSLLLALVVILPAIFERGSATAMSGPSSSLSIPEPLWKGSKSQKSGDASLPGLDAWRSHVANEAAFFTSPLRSKEGGATLPSRPNSPKDLPPPVFGAMAAGIESVIADQAGARAFAIGSPMDAGPGPLALWRVILYIIGPIIVFVGAGSIKFARGRTTVTIHER
ncbi:MAG TPA: hypothetical protein VMV44_04475, partial [Rectinemataceae bacterium]|nr:hypothetical protein [Rectinemataceae bacterium]